MPAASSAPLERSPSGIDSLIQAAKAGLSCMICSAGLLVPAAILNMARVAMIPNTPKAANTRFKTPKTVTEAGRVISF